ncbi:MAG: heparan-alpha-glucosaminide N-acetyltransferase [Pseudomonadota bacterium]
MQSRARLPALTARHGTLDALRGTAVLWMTCFHFAFDLNHFGFIHQDFYRDPVWTVQRTCILSLFLLCAGVGQAVAVHAGQTWGRFWRRWLQIAACAVAVSVGSALMFPNSWIYFGVLHGMAVMLLVCRTTASWGRWLWPAGLVVVMLGAYAPQVQTWLPFGQAWDVKALNWLGLVSRKPVTEDYVPLLPWLGVMWWGMAAGQWALARGWMAGVGQATQAWPLAPLSWLGRCSLSWYMVHQPVLIGLLTLVGSLR